MRKPLGSSALTLFALVVASGCIPDLSGWTIGRTGPDGAIVPPEGACAPPVTCGDCPLPWLLASVEDLGDGCGGQVWRWSLAGPDEGFCACTPLTASGAMPRLPFSVGFVPPQTVVIAAQSQSVLAIDGTTDTVLWSEPYPGRPVDIFAIEDLSGRPMVGVAGSDRGGDIRSVAFYDAAVGGAPIERSLNGDLPVGLGIAGITQSPLDRRWFRSLKSNGWAASDVNPWTSERFGMPNHTEGRDGFFLHTIHASYDGAMHRTLWTGERSDLPDRPSGVFQLARAEDTGGNRVPTRDSCQTYPDGLAYDVTCDYLHAVADPLSFSSSFAICEHGTQRRIVRLQSAGDCYTIVEQSEVYPNARISRLAIAQASLWE